MILNCVDPTQLDQGNIVSPLYTTTYQVFQLSNPKIKYAEIQALILNVERERICWKTISCLARSSLLYPNDYFLADSEWALRNLCFRISEFRTFAVDSFRFRRYRVQEAGFVSSTFSFFQALACVTTKKKFINVFLIKIANYFDFTDSPCSLIIYFFYQPHFLQELNHTIGFY